MKTKSLHAFLDDSAQASALGNLLGLQPDYVQVHIFPDGEILPRVTAPGNTAIFHRSLNLPNQKLIELLLSADACRRAGAQRLVLVAPYMPYMRQDTVFSAGEPKSQSVIGKLLAAAFDHIITVDAHLHRTPHLADIFPGVEAVNLRSADVIAQGLSLEDLPQNTLIVGPDLESSQWVGAIASKVGLESAVFTKTRHGDRDVSLDLPKGLSVAGRPVILADDICSSGGTLRAAIVKLREEKAGAIQIVITHALFDADAERSFLALGATRIRSTDSCSHPTNAFALAPLLAASLGDIFQ